MINKKTIYVSLDVETDGPNIHLNSCIMLGIAVSKPLDEIIGFENESDWIIEKRHWCIKPLFGRQRDKETMDQFWSKNVELYNYIKINDQHLATVSEELYQLLEKLNTEYRVVYVARPTSFDIPWVKVVLDSLVYPNNLSHTGLCISTMLKVCDYLGVDRKELDKVIRNDKLPHTHYADDDALQQLYMFIKLKEFLSKLSK